MAVSVYKWLFLAILSINWPVFKPDYHPFHVSVVEMNHNAAEKTLEISCKIFTDDFEKVLAQNYPKEVGNKLRVDLINPPDRKAMDSLVKKYILSHLSIIVNGRSLNFSYLGFERDNEAIFSYIQAENIPSVKQMEITNKLMQDMFTDQVNIMHVIVNGERKSTKLDYPKNTASFSY
jgi:hypothetical protein